MILQGPEIPWCSFWMVVDMPVGVQATGVWFRQRQTAETGLTEQTVQKTRDPWCSSGKVLTRPLVCKRQGYGSDSTENWRVCTKIGFWEILTFHDLRGRNASGSRQ